jgi:hypothetical protein
VPYSGIFKELAILSTTSWVTAQVLIGAKMVRDPASLRLGYINPFKPRSGKQIPSSLDSQEEWSGLIQHVKRYLEDQQSKNRGKGGKSKAWSITIVDLASDPSNVSPT